MITGDDWEELPVRLGLVSTYPPRRCGPATYAAELGRALAPEFDLVVCAVDRYGSAYPDEVVAVIHEDDPDDYRRAARVLAEHGVDVALVHYDAGTMGGPHLRGLADELTRLGLPYVLSLHRAPGADDADLRAAVEGAERLLVFTAADRERLTGAAPTADRIELVPFGVPSVLGPGRRQRRVQLANPPRPAVTSLLAGLGPGPVLASVGAFGPERDLTTTLDALPTVLAGHPDARLILAGLTEEREAIRAELDQRGLAGAVHLLDLRLSPVELGALLARTDVVLAPALPADRSWSASTAAAVTAGRPVVARRHPYPQELLAGGAGVIVDPGDPAGLATAVLGYLDDAARSAAARSAARSTGRRLTWPAVANRYAGVLRQAARPAVPAAPTVADLRLDRGRGARPGSARTVGPAGRGRGRPGGAVPRGALPTTLAAGSVLAGHGGHRARGRRGHPAAAAGSGRVGPRQYRRRAGRTPADAGTGPATARHGRHT